jgi:hypothetical protein
VWRLLSGQRTTLWTRADADRHPAAGRARERAISRAAITVSPASENLTAAAGRLGRISVRTLLPLANHVRAVLASRNADLEGSGGRNLDRMLSSRTASSGRPPRLWPQLPVETRRQLAQHVGRLCQSKLWGRVRPC